MLFGPLAAILVDVPVAPSAGLNKNCVEAIPAGASQKIKLGNVFVISWQKFRDLRPSKCTIRKIGRKVLNANWRTVAYRTVAVVLVARVVMGSLIMIRFRSWVLRVELRLAWGADSGRRR